MSEAAWIIVSTVGAAIILAAGRSAVRIAKYQARLTADAVTEAIGDTLLPKFEVMVDQKLASVHTKLNGTRALAEANRDRLQAIDEELTLNGGDTLKDAVYTLLRNQGDMQNQLERALTTEPRRKDA